MKRFAHIPPPMSYYPKGAGNRFVPLQNMQSGGGCMVVAIALFLCLVGACNAQTKHDWRTLIERKDTLAVGPLSDVRTWAAYRVSKNIQARQCAFELVQLDRQVRELQEANDNLHKSLDDARRLYAIQSDAVVEQADEARRWRAKAKRRNPVVYFLAGALVGGIAISAAQ